MMGTEMKHNLATRCLLLLYRFSAMFSYPWRTTSLPRSIIKCSHYYRVFSMRDLATELVPRYILWSSGTILFIRPTDCPGSGSPGR